MTKSELLNYYDQMLKEYPSKKFRKFEENHIFDEEKSVRWNREEIKRKNEEIEEQSKQYHKERQEAFEQFDSMLIRYLLSYSDLNEKQVKIIYDYAYQKFHSYGLSDVINNTLDILDLVEKVIKQ